MKKFLFAFLITLLASSASLSAQDNKNFVSKLNAFPLGGGVEFRIKDSFTVYSGLGLGLNFAYKDNTFKANAPLFLGVNPRFYYNIQKRKSQGKRVDKFSGNYVGISFVKGLTSWGSPDLELIASIAPVWGLQRNIGKSGYFNLNVGLGANFWKDKTTLSVGGAIALGLAF
jgi:hypothetical protein